MSDLIDRAEAACRFPVNTCPASRHAAGIGVALVRGEPYPMLTDEPDHCGESILSVVASLWEARTQIERLTAALQYEQHRAGRQGTHGEGCADWGPEHYECAIRERDDLRRQLAEAELDAERYRWLRGDLCPDHSVRWTQWEVRCWKAPSWTGDLRRADLDDAIDAARGKE